VPPVVPVEMHYNLRWAIDHLDVSLELPIHLQLHFFFIMLQGSKK